MLIGAGCIGAGDEVVRIGDRIGAGVAKALLGKAAVPDDFALCTGTIGLLGTAPSANLMNECDALLMVGMSFPYAEFLPKEGARGIQIDIDPRNLGIRYPTELNIVGDASLSLAALLPLLRGKEDRAWREKIESSIKHWNEVERSRAMEDADPINPQRVFRELSPVFPIRHPHRRRGLGDELVCPPH